MSHNWLLSNGKAILDPRILSVNKITNIRYAGMVRR